ncbi:BrnA antitoxin family protein [Sphingomonas fuzhouensis]|uniref:BrnA antitoxin family protein n=1 Tax=Sphingomonas fuzhouensis TaxID=3106033 RepID=UPI002AFEC98C|nr:BrnA antitoxin family protein [Sphingomonas sp. SGZ-02]
MASDKPPVRFDSDNPEWTEEDFAKSRPAVDVLSADVLAAFGRKRGRPKGATSSTKSPVTIRVDNDVLDRFRSSGRGWQSRMNETLRGAVATDHSLIAAARGQGIGARFSQVQA